MKRKGGIERITMVDLIKIEGSRLQNVTDSKVRVSIFSDVKTGKVFNQEVCLDPYDSVYISGLSSCNPTVYASYYAMDVDLANYLSCMSDKKPSNVQQCVVSSGVSR